METEKLFYKDPFLTEFTATVLDCQPGKNGYIVTLDRTAFYPEGGKWASSARKIPEQPPGIHTGVAYDRERKPAVISLRVLRRYNNGTVTQLRQFSGIVYHSIGNTVDQRRKGIVQKADALGCLHTLFSFVLFCSVQARRT